MKITIPLVVHAHEFYLDKDGIDSGKIAGPWRRYIKRKVREHYQNSIGIARPEEKFAIKTKKTIHKDEIKFLNDAIESVLEGQYQPRNPFKYVLKLCGMKKIGRKIPRKEMDTVFFLMGGEFPSIKLNNCHYGFFEDMVEWSKRNADRQKSITLVLPSKGIFSSNIPAEQVLRKYNITPENYQNVFERYIKHASKNAPNATFGYNKNELTFKMKY
ncbi:MAG: hypothetical protein JSV39_02795 [Candidatus Aenigmatarchaeota archaeon]|nr:MAG: hypothetical protein JSV39_02795 [Candidatus Aenigmarchaeota archaeon]